MPDEKELQLASSARGSRRLMCRARADSDADDFEIVLFRCQGRRTSVCHGVNVYIAHITRCMYNGGAQMCTTALRSAQLVHRVQAHTVTKSLTLSGAEVRAQRAHLEAVPRVLDGRLMHGRKDEVGGKPACTQARDSCARLVHNLWTRELPVSSGLTD